jgi:hypothetical protein
MKIKTGKIILVALLVFFGLGFKAAYAQNVTIPTTPANPSNPTTPATPVNPTTPASPTTQSAPVTNCATAPPGTPNCLYNPLPTGDFTTFVLLIMKWILGLIGIFAVLFIMIGGFRMITSQGNEEAYGVAKKTVTYAVIGLVVAVLSFSMIAIVENLLQANITNVNTTTQTTSP